MLVTMPKRAVLVTSVTDRKKSRHPKSMQPFMIRYRAPCLWYSTIRPYMILIIQTSPSAGSIQASPGDTALTGTGLLQVTSTQCTASPALVQLTILAIFL